MRRVRWADDRGETLVELLVALLIMGTAVVAVAGGLGTAILMSDIHRKQSVIEAKLSEYAAAVSNGVATTPGYVACPASPSFPSYGAGAGYTVDPIQVSYWDGSSAFVGTCPAGGDTGVQQVTLRIHSNDGRVTRSMNVIIRKPCRPTDASCG
jgi:type II secretory pathway pseudopilin PulG